MDSTGDAESLTRRFLPLATNRRAHSSLTRSLPTRSARDRLKTADVLAAKRERLARQRAAFDELRRLEEELDQF